MDHEEIPAAVNELLAIDRTLHPSDRAVLSTLLVNPRPATARDLSRTTRTNLHALYTALDRLESRGLVVRHEGGRTRTYRVAHPSVVLQELSQPWKRAEDLATGLEEPLRTLYEMGEVRLTSSRTDRVGFTSSLPSCLSALVDRLRTATGDVWFLGSEQPWIGHSGAIESQLLLRRQGADPPRVRFLLRRADSTSARARQHQRFRRAGLEVRNSDLWSSSAVVIDRRWLFVEAAHEGKPGRTGTHYVWLEAPTLCQDIVRSSEAAWSQAAPLTAREGVVRSPMPA